MTWATDQDRKRRETVLPAWAHGLTARTQNGLILENRLTRAEVREVGPSYWMRVPNLGRRSVRELEAAIGGWDAPPEITREDLPREVVRLIDGARPGLRDPEDLEALWVELRIVILQVAMLCGLAVARTKPERRAAVEALFDRKLLEAFERIDWE